MRRVDETARMSKLLCELMKNLGKPNTRSDILGPIAVQEAPECLSVT